MREGERDREKRKCRNCERHYAWREGGAGKYISSSEGSQAVPARPFVEVTHMIGINFLHDVRGAAL
jgi:hypothetical protein